MRRIILLLSISAGADDGTTQVPTPTAQCGPGTPRVAPLACALYGQKCVALLSSKPGRITNAVSRIQKRYDGEHDRKDGGDDGRERPAQGGRLDSLDLMRRGVERRRRDDRRRGRLWFDE